MDYAQKRILLDLTKDYRDKIHRAGAHMESMCELADIDHDDMVSAVWAVNLRFVIEIINMTTDMSAEDFGIACAESLREYRTNSRRASKR